MFSLAFLSFIFICIFLIAFKSIIFNLFRAITKVSIIFFFIGRMSRCFFSRNNKVIFFTRDFFQDNIFKSFNFFFKMLYISFSSTIYIAIIIVMTRSHSSISSRRFSIFYQRRGCCSQLMILIIISI
jgi:hypothetical protein